MIAGFVDTLIERNILDALHRDEYIYVLTLRVERYITYTILAILAIITGNIFYSIIYGVTFIMLRKTTGGFHAETFAGCLTGTILLFLLSTEILVPFLSRHLWIMAGALGGSVAWILLFSPVNHPNIQLSDEEQADYRRWSRIEVCICLILVGLGRALNMRWQQYIAVGIITCAVFMAIAKITGQEVEAE